VRLAEHIRVRYAEVKIGTPKGDIAVSDLSQDSLLSMVRYSISKTKHYDITWQSSIACFTALIFLMGPRFDEHAAIRRELEDEQVSSNAKVDHLCFVTTKRTWREAKAMHGAQPWNSVVPEIAARRDKSRAYGPAVRG